MKCLQYNNRLRIYQGFTVSQSVVLHIFLKLLSVTVNLDGMKIEVSFWLSSSNFTKYYVLTNMKLYINLNFLNNIKIKLNPIDQSDR